MAKNLKLSTEEKGIITAIRELHAAERRHKKTADGLREHGGVTLGEAAKLLGVRRSELDAMLGTKLPRPDAHEGGRMPTSELLRYVERRAAAELHALHLRVGALFAPASNRTWFVSGDEQQWGRHSLAAAAAELDLTEREVRRLVDENKLFAVRLGRGGLTVSREEIAAFKAKREAKLTVLNKIGFGWTGDVSRALDASLMASPPSTAPVIRRATERRAA